MSLRNCQENAIKTYEEIITNKSKNYTNISMCTGSGKTRVIQEIIRNQKK